MPRQKPQTGRVTLKAASPTPPNMRRGYIGPRVDSECLGYAFLPQPTCSYLELRGNRFVLTTVSKSVLIRHISSHGIDLTDYFSMSALPHSSSLMRPRATEALISGSCRYSKQCLKISCRNRLCSGCYLRFKPYTAPRSVQIRSRVCMYTPSHFLVMIGCSCSVRSIRLIRIVPT